MMSNSATRIGLKCFRRVMKTWTWSKEIFLHKRVKQRCTIFCWTRSWIYTLESAMRSKVKLRTTWKSTLIQLRYAIMLLFMSIWTHKSSETSTNVLKFYYGCPNPSASWSVLEKFHEHNRRCTIWVSQREIASGGLRGLGSASFQWVNWLFFVLLFWESENRNQEFHLLHMLGLVMANTDYMKELGTFISKSGRFKKPRT